MQCHKFRQPATGRDLVDASCLISRHKLK